MMSLGKNLAMVSSAEVDAKPWVLAASARRVCMAPHGRTRFEHGRFRQPGKSSPSPVIGSLGPELVHSPPSLECCIASTVANLLGQGWTWHLAPQVNGRFVQSRHVNSAARRLDAHFSCDGNGLLIDSFDGYGPLEPPQTFCYDRMNLSRTCCALPVV